MHTRELKVSIKVSAPKSVIDSTDGPYFYNIGFEKEEFVAKNEVENGLEAWFEGFELITRTGEAAVDVSDEELVTAKLHYTVLVEGKSK
ncbi:hypothetical protein [Sphingobacterium yanglingense]|uniref:Uncharacterized protein n=1 Tax=Sphingobacterium yanglingense TaxID=1437280 RepID=A0A4R6WI93_9SPHI|nr:hypothetical protein [Sphingobacterium yanglingense]TDQ78061.1 hypothetical protein CLV99_2038 [Sphingobacterium yanglingense]